MKRGQWPKVNLGWTKRSSNQVVLRLSCSSYLNSLRWEVSGRTAAVLCGVSSRISSRQHVAFLSCSHLAFSLRVLLVFMWCIHVVVNTQLRLGRNSVLSYRIDQTSI